MSTKTQRDYINDLAVLKTKEFKEVKELLGANQIGGDVIANAQTIAEITNALDNKQASTLIDVLIAAKAPDRSNAYAKPRIERTIGLLDDIKATVDDWGF